jgi:UDP-3-O-[3-hydroxymyristoyl] glucosamine N-acyltransferase
MNERLLYAQEQEKIQDYTKMVFLHESWIRNDTVFIGRHKIGKCCVIGGDGFGYEPDENGTLIHVPHRGKVIIGENVVIHNNVCIDRATDSGGITYIGAGSKIDNLVHVAHNVKIGKNCLIVAGSVIGGSCEIGDNCFIGINASIKNKVKIGNGVTVGMGAVITKDVPDGVTVIGVNKILS